MSFLQISDMQGETVGSSANAVIRRVYADLDTECLRPFSSLFMQHDIPLSSHSSLTSSHDILRTSTTNATSNSSSTITSSTSSLRTAFLGRMGTDNSKKHSIPNAWMGSTPSHPFWLLPLDLVASGARPYGDWPEAVTGPDALFYLVNKYLREYSGNRDADARLDEYIRSSRLDEVYLRSLGGQGFRTRLGDRQHQVVVLGHDLIFPYWWGEKELESVCRAGIASFDPETCKDVLDVQALGSWSITYWSHSWDKESGHDEGHLSAMESRVGFSGSKRWRA